MRADADTQEAVAEVFDDARRLADEANVLIADALRIVELEGTDPTSPEGQRRMTVLLSNSLRGFGLGGGYEG